MPTAQWKNRSLSIAAAVVMLASAAALRADDESGVVRITDQPTTVAQQVSATEIAGPAHQCGHGHVHGPVHGDPHLTWSGPEYVLTGNPVKDLFTHLRMKANVFKVKHGLHHGHHGCSSCKGFGRGHCTLCAGHPKGGGFRHVGHGTHHPWLAPFGYFCPTGCGGAGCPPLGHYHAGYALNPDYFDFRDGGVYAAQGYGLPVAVPLAPNVEHTYNYGWGVPSSRLTPVSRRFHEPGIIPQVQPVAFPPAAPTALNLNP
jgi:hypothetical protein